VREAVKKHRQGITKGITLEGVNARVLHLANALLDPDKRSKLTLISKALDKTMTGLDGKPLKLGSMVRYGISGYTMNEIGELLQW